jgi:hypothetical protein
VAIELRRARWGRKSAEWLRRYAPAETLATCCALFDGPLVGIGNPVLAALRVVRNLALEFGVAELLDSFLVRPAAMFAMIRMTGSLPLGLVFGKVTADLVFNCAAIGAYEARKHYLGE